MKRIMVDMSATIIHHGHIRLIQKAAQYGDVVIGLTTDDQIHSQKGYKAELTFDQRKEILEAVRGVKEVVPTPWRITETLLDRYEIDLLVHGHDNRNPVSKERLLVFDRTKGISSTGIRQKCLKTTADLNNKKLMLTPGPAAVLHENLQHLSPVFGRGDAQYEKMSHAVLSWIKEVAGQDEIVAFQGSATLALELAAHTFVSGKVLLVTTGYYSDRMERLLPPGCRITRVGYDALERVDAKFDWVVCAYTETSIAYKVDLKRIKAKAEACGALLYADATGSIGLEDHHQLCDLTAFSSCKGLFGLTGAAFIGYKSSLVPKTSSLFYFNLQTQKDKLVTGPYHAIASLYGVMPRHDLFKKRVNKSKQHVLEKYAHLTRGHDNQPLLCTYLDGKVIPKDKNVVLYSPRSPLSGSVICHFGEIHQDSIELSRRIVVEEY